MIHRKEMSLGEALAVFDFNLEANITENLIKSKFRELALLIHTDKNKTIDKKEAGEKLASIVSAKKILLKNLDILITPENRSKIINEKLDTTFIDFIKGSDDKNKPFTIYKKGRG
jgi:hypothetical protein